MNAHDSFLFRSFGNVTTLRFVFPGFCYREGKVMLVGGTSNDLVAKGLDSVAWIRDVASPVKGGGGGRVDMAHILAPLSSETSYSV